MNAVQMNTRINADVKAAGDSVFASIGYTPSEIVRIVWGYAAAIKDKPLLVKKTLSSLQSVSLQEEASALDKKLQAIEQGANLHAQLMGQLGISGFGSDQNFDAKAELENRLWEKYSQSGEAL